MAAIEKVRVLIVGDSGVGKTSLIHLICHNEPIANPYWTIGCSVECKLHEYKAGTLHQKDYFIELWDIGGWSAHTNSRSIFYNPVHGVILVHDLTNRKTEQNLRKWLGEVLNKEQKERIEGHDYDPEIFAGTQVPILLIGTKVDMAESVQKSRRRSGICEECGADEITLDCTQVKHLAPGTSNAVTLSRFFDKVIERKYYARESNATSINAAFTSPIQVGGLFQDRRRVINTKND
ncbi:DgyrCDS7259 [Dimorphilus gyrociliatus]|uniref:Rab-like protein 3 n=1 Tax=Dimorphilus gyrociliatus TaxID=2664684 RepID=A0A7I8VRG6_9ANNE|nr:DgyrCDS7259 [Dimorphilus gyrociliatus]